MALGLSYEPSLFVRIGIVTEETHRTLFTYYTSSTKNNDRSSHSPYHMKNELFYTVIHDTWDIAYHMIRHWLSSRGIVTRKRRMTNFTYYHT
jgi:hypothetical protein